MNYNFSIHYFTRPSENLFLCGSIPELGSWDTNKALRMQYNPSSIWSVSLFLPKINFDIPIFFKALIKTDNHFDNLISIFFKGIFKTDKPAIIWEAGPNRILIKKKSQFNKNIDIPLVWNFTKVTLKFFWPGAENDNYLLVWGNKNDIGTFKNQKKAVISDDGYFKIEFFINTGETNFIYEVARIKENDIIGFRKSPMIDLFKDDEYSSDNQFIKLKNKNAQFILKSIIHVDYEAPRKFSDIQGKIDDFIKENNFA